MDEEKEEIPKEELFSYSNEAFKKSPYGFTSNGYDESEDGEEEFYSSFIHPVELPPLTSPEFKPISPETAQKLNEEEKLMPQKSLQFQENPRLDLEWIVPKLRKQRGESQPKEGRQLMEIHNFNPEHNFNMFNSTGTISKQKKGKKGVNKKLKTRRLLNQLTKLKINDDDDSETEKEGDDDEWTLKQKRVPRQKPRIVKIHSFIRFILHRQD